jgi:enediyne polyketide synthase
VTPAIAIVGMACRYPDARDPGELWENVLAQRRAFRRMPDERLRLADYHSPDRAAPDRTYAAQAAVIEGWEFDRVAFRVVGSTYRAADLAHWLALESADRALADAGFEQGEGLPRRATGVLLGNTLTGEFTRANLMRLRWPYVRRMLDAKLAGEGWDEDRRAAFLAGLETDYKAPFPPIGEETLAGGLSNTIAGRICNHFDLKGGGYTVDGACAASLLAVTTACAALVAGDLDVAVAGGVDLSLDPFELVGFAKTGALAPELMRVYDRRSAGFWPGEGCGMIVLMRLEDAEAQGRRVAGVIRGWGVSSDGGGGITRPTIDGQLLALTRAYDRAGFGVDTVTCFEGHGTGTAVGDANELRVLSRARREAGATGADAAISSIKANFGHTKAAAGIAGLIKAVQAVRHELLPPVTGCEQPHEELDGPGAVLRVLRAGEAWPADRPRRAAVSAMGFGGINTHVVVEGHGPRRRAAIDDDERRMFRAAQGGEVFLFGGADGSGLARSVAGVAAYAGRVSRAELTDLAAALAGDLGDAPEARAAVIASTPTELDERLATLRGLIEHDVAPSVGDHDGVFLASGRDAPRVGFVFPGQGSPVRRDAGAWARRFDPVAALYADLALPDADDDVSTLVAQPAIVAGALAALAVLDHLGVEASAATGHSLGELAALHWAGAYDAAALLRIATARGRAMAELGSATGAMASLPAAPADVRSLVGDLPLVISGFNGPGQTVVSGEADAVDTVVARARARALGAVRLPVSHAFHSELVRAAAPALADRLAGETFAAPRRSVVSTVTGGPLDPGEDLRRLLERQVLSPVRFTDAAMEMDRRADLLVEVGPGTVMSGMLRRFVTAPVVATDAGGDSLRGLLETVGAAWALGAPVRIERLFADRFHRPFDLDWRPSFLASPCESAPVADAPAPDVAVPAAGDDGGPGPDIADDATPLELLRALVAHRAELPVASVNDDDRFLSDLHLNSITVGQMMTEAARRLALAPPAAPTEYADASLAEAATALARLAETGGVAAAEDDDADRAPAGVDTWVRAFTVDLVERPRPQRTPPPRGDAWRVLAPEGHDLADRLRAALARDVPGGGVAVCLPPEPGLEHLDLLLEGAQAALRHRDDTRFVLVQHGGGGAALARTLHIEAPQITTCVVDVLPGDDGAVERITAEAAAATGYVEAHYDEAGRRHEPRLRHLELDPAGDDATPALDEGDVLLVTGGGKGIAAECALALARATGASLVLMGRSDPGRDETLRANLERLEAHGVRFTYVSADVTDAAAVARTLADTQQRTGPITALLHGAGANVPQLLGALDTMALRRTFAPKVQGAENVLAALDPRRLRLLMGLGSIIARIGLNGEADYALANEWLTRLVERWQRDHPHCRCVAVESSVWASVGMGERLGRADTLHRYGVAAIPVDRGIEWVTRLAGASLPATAVVLTARFGAPPTLRPAGDELPLRRFLERPRVHYPGIELVADSTVSADTDLYVDDHVLHDERLVPAVIGLEAMAQAALALAGRDEPPVLESVRFNRPIIVPRGGETTLRVAALRRSSGAVHVALRSGESDFQVDHFSAICRFDDAGDVPAAAPAAGDRLLSVDPMRDLYGGILFHGGRFRRLGGYRHLKARACEAEIAADGTSRWFAQYLPPRLLLGDPAVRDAAIHAIQACLPHARLVPVGARRVRLGLLPHAEPCRARAIERARDGDTFVYDLEITGADGAVLECWEGLDLRAVEAIAPSASWPAPLLVPYLERRAEEIVPGATAAVAVETNGTAERTRRSDEALRHALGQPLRVVRRPDGRPEVADPPGADGPGATSVSVAHAGSITFAVAGRGPVGCDLEPVVARSADAWHDLLPGERFDLAALVAREAGEDADTAATRIWAATECLVKARAAGDAPLTFESSSSDGWIVLASGPLHIATYATGVRTAESPLVFALLVGAADD